MSVSGFAAPWWLVLGAVVVGALLAGYVWVQRLRHNRVLRFTNLALLEKVAPAGPNVSRHIPTALLLVGLMMLTDWLG